MFEKRKNNKSLGEIILGLSIIGLFSLGKTLSWGFLKLIGILILYNGLSQLKDIEQEFNKSEKLCRVLGVVTLLNLFIRKLVDVGILSEIIFICMLFFVIKGVVKYTTSIDHSEEMIRRIFFAFNIYILQDGLKVLSKFFYNTAIEGISKLMFLYAYICIIVIIHKFKSAFKTNNNI